MGEAKSVEIKSIHVLSVFKFFGGLFFIIGLIVGLFGSLLWMNIIPVKIAQVLPPMFQSASGVLTGIVFAVGYGLIAGISYSVTALLYNFFAMLFGGVKISVKE